MTGRTDEDVMSSSASILELDEARRRLQQMEQDHLELLQLIERLKSMDGSLESASRAVQDRGERVEEALVRARTIARKLRGGIERLAAEGDAVIQRIERSRQEMVASFEELRMTIEQQQAQCSQDRQAVEAASRTQAADIVSVRQESRSLHEEAMRQFQLEISGIRATFESTLRAQLTNTRTEMQHELRADRQKLRSLIDRRTYLISSAAIVALLLGGYGAVTRPRSPDSDANARASAVNDPGEGKSAPREKEQLANAAPPTSVASAAEPVPTREQEPDKDIGLRIWTDHLGRTVQARFEGLRDDTVFLRKTATGKLYPIPLTGLSPADQAFVQRLASRTGY
jgi:hypothetical protein